MKASVIIIIILCILVAIYFGVNSYMMKDVKIPKYQVIQKAHGHIEIRLYAPMIVAEVTTQGSRQEAISKGFRILADYIFGNNQAGAGQHKIKMTAPVLQQKSEEIAMTAPVMQSANEKGEDSWQVQFVMPETYTLATLPKPNNKAITIIQLPSHETISIRFSGKMSNASLASHLKKLNAYIKANDIKTEGQPQYAFYNPPWTLPFLRRNEISYQIKPHP